jgi:dTDP-4-dehydrorhamnose reductase
VKILVLGAGGMAGHVIATYLKEAGLSVDTLSAKNKLNDETFLVDVTNQNLFGSFLENRQYDVIINAIGLLVKQSEDRKDLSTYINSYLPHYLEHMYHNTTTRIIQLSTDCVFSGKNAPYSEDSVYDGELYYDRTKALGEIINEKDLTFRMSIIGPDHQKDGIGLFNWFYAQTGEILGFTKAIWNGVTTIELSKAIKAAIEQNTTGLYHLVPDGNISKFNLLKLFKKVFDRQDITIKSDDGLPLDKTLINNRADFSHNVPDYPSMINEMKDWIDTHPGLYSHYKRSSL